MRARRSKERVKSAIFLRHVSKQYGLHASGSPSIVRTVQPVEQLGVQ